MSRPFQALPNQVSENILLGEVLGADDIARTGCRCQYRQRRNQDAAQEHHAARPDAKSPSPGDAAPDQAPPLVDDKGQTRRYAPAERSDDRRVGTERAPTLPS